MEREYLKGLGISDDAIEKIMTQHGKAITAAKKAEADAQKQTIAERDAQIAGLQNQIGQRDKDIEAMKGSISDVDTIKTQLDEMQKKYKTDTDALNKQLADQKEGFERQTATEKFFSGYKFSSQMAKKAVMAEFATANLKMKNGEFEGAKDWIENMKKSSADAFAVEQVDEPPKPYFGGGTKPNGQNEPPKNPFGLEFNKVRMTKE